MAINARQKTGSLHFDSPVTSTKKNTQQFGQRLVFAQQFAFKLLDAFFVFARLLAVFFLLGFFLLLAADNVDLEINQTKK